MTRARTKGQKLAEKRRRQLAVACKTGALDLAPIQKREVEAPTVEAEGRPKAVRPTPERLARGAFRMPRGSGRQEMPAHDEAHDALAKLRRSGLITQAQEESGRYWQGLKADVRAHIGATALRSCLDNSPRGHSEDDVDPEIAAEILARWRDVESALGPWKVGSLDWTCVLGNLPRNMGSLRLLRVSLNSLGRC